MFELLQGKALYKYLLLFLLSIAYILNIKPVKLCLRFIINESYHSKYVSTLFFDVV